MTRRSSLRFCARREPGACAVLVDDVAMRARSAPACLKPRRFLRSEDQPVDPSVMDRMRAAPVHVPASERRLARRAIEREDRWTRSSR